MIRRSLKLTIASLVLLLMVAFASLLSFKVKAEGTFTGATPTEESGDTVYTLSDGGRLDYSETTGNYNMISFKWRPNSSFGSDDAAHLTLYISTGSSYASFRLLNYWKAVDILNYAQDFSSSTYIMNAVNYADNGGGGWTRTDEWFDVKVGFNTKGIYYSVNGVEFIVPNTNHYDFSNKQIFFGCWACTPSIKDFTLSNNDEWYDWRGNCDLSTEDGKTVYTANTSSEIKRIDYLGNTHADTVEFKVKYPADYAGDTTNVSFYISNGTNVMRFYTFPYWNYFNVEIYNADVTVCQYAAEGGNYTNVGSHGAWGPTNEWLTIKLEFASKHTAAYINGEQVFKYCANLNFDFTNTDFFFTIWGALASLKEITLSDNNLQPAHTVVTDAAVAATCTEAGKTEGSHCSVCNEVLVAQETVAALGHDLVDDAAVAATCTTAGKTAGHHCSRCDYKDGGETVAALGHDLVDDAAVAATCTEAGKTAGHHCSRCDYKDGGETVAALGHDLVDDAAVAATCTTAGKTAGHHCSRCDYKDGGETVAALGHDLVDDAAVAATCTTAGKTAGHHCSRCDYKDGGETVAALGHSASSQTYHTDDKHFNICTRCGFALDFENLSAPTDYTDARWTQRKYTTEWVSMSGQMRVREKNGSKVVNMAAGYSTTMQYIMNFNGTTPIAKGNSFTIDLGNYFSGAKPMGVKVSLLVKFGGYTQTVYVLGSTDDYYTFPVTTALETFTYVADMEVEVYEIRITNKSNNSGNFYLYMDNVRIFTTMNIANHTMTDDPTAPAQAATCTEAGKTAGKVCSCGYKVEGTTIDALGHDLVDDAAVAATCTESGKTAGHHCTRCNYTDGGEIIEAKGHTLVDDLAVAATCTEAGKTAGQHCSVCNAIIVAQTDTPALGHDLVDDPAVAATCTEAGKTAGHHCSRCDYKDGGETVAALGHDLVEDAAVAATCTEAGKAAGHHCTRCDYTDGGETIDALGHDWGEWVQTKAPTTTEEGEETRTCKNDPTHTETRPVDRLPENPTTQAPTTQAPVTQAPATQAPQTQAPKTQTEPAQTGKKGCKNALVPSILGVAFLLGSIVVIKRKREE